MLNANQSIQASGMLKAISHPVRLQLLALLCKHKHMCVSDLHTALAIEQAVVSQHLKVMKVKGVLNCSKSGTQVFYEVAHSRYNQLLKSILNCHEA